MIDSSTTSPVVPPHPARGPGTQCQPPSGRLQPGRPCGPAARPIRTCATSGAQPRGIPGEPEARAHRQLVEFTTADLYRPLWTLFSSDTTEEFRSATTIHKGYIEARSTPDPFLEHEAVLPGNPSEYRLFRSTSVIVGSNRFRARRRSRGRATNRERGAESGLLVIGAGTPHNPSRLRPTPRAPSA